MMAGRSEASVDCRECKTEVKKNDKGLMCDGCHVWYHIKCIDISVNLYTAITKFDSRKGVYTGTAESAINTWQKSKLMYRKLYWA